MKGFSYRKAASALTLAIAAYFSTPSFAGDLSGPASLGCMSCHVGAAMQAEVLSRKVKGHLARSKQTKATTTTALASSSKKTQ